MIYFKQLQKTIFKGQLIARYEVEELVGYKESENYKQFQFEILKLQQQIELYTKRQGKAMFTRQDAGGIKIMTDEEADDYKTDMQYRLLKKCSKIQQQKKEINTAQMSAERRMLYHNNLSKFGCYLEDIKTRAIALDDKQMIGNINSTKLKQMFGTSKAN